MPCANAIRFQALAKLTAGLSFSTEGFFSMVSKQLSSVNKPAAFRLKALSTRAAAAAGGLLMSGAAMASSGDNTFAGFKEMVVDWAQGPLGTGLAVTFMLIGAGMGIARNSPMPALSGIAAAAFLNWGPGIIEKLLPGVLI